MKFECGDLERALAGSDLMPEAREHLKNCAACRREYRLWTDMSDTARGLHDDWESPDLWPKILSQLEAEPKAAPARWRQPRLWLAAASVACVFIAAPFFFRSSHVAPVRTEPALSTAASTDHDFLTEQALAEVEKNEAAYRLSIDKLSRVAAPKLSNASSPAVVNANEKLQMIDSAISETRSNIASNRFNTQLQSTLADLYREKQQTLEEVLGHRHDQKN